MTHIANGNNRDRAGRTPLHYAVIDEPKELKRIAAQTDPALAEQNRQTANEYKVANTTQLLADGADVDAADDEGYTPLLFAAADDSVDVVRLLLEAGANLEAFNTSGETALYRAVRNTTSGAVPITQLLLEAGADPNAELANGSSPLKFVRRSQKAGIAELFADLL